MSLHTVSNPEQKLHFMPLVFWPWNCHCQMLTAVLWYWQDISNLFPCI